MLLDLDRSIEDGDECINDLLSRGALGAPRGALGAPRGAPRGALGAPRGALGAPRGAPRDALGAPRGAPRGARGAPRGARGALGRCLILDFAESAQFSCVGVQPDALERDRQDLTD